jgi:Zn-ribbon RNA-binding protein
LFFGLMKKAIKCSATNQELINDKGSVIFKCPNCLQADIVRSNKCRVLAARYVCPSCGFEGPN